MTDLRAVALGLADFIDSSPSPYHACATAAARLDAAGFVRLDERAAWEALRSVLISSEADRSWPGRSGARRPRTGFPSRGGSRRHPNLRVKPRPDTGGAGFRQIGVEVYGGVLLNSWLDRDLGLPDEPGSTRGEGWRNDCSWSSAPSCGCHNWRSTSTVPSARRA